jgi:thymidylate synthase
MTEHLTTNAAYRRVLHDLVHRPQYVSSPRGLPCREIVDYHFRVLDPRPESLLTASRTRDEVMARYLAAEEKLYASGELRASVWAAEASAFWGKLANPDGTINSNYGHLIFQRRSIPGERTPWEWARESILRDTDTRQAYVRVALPEHQRPGNADQVCTLHLNFLVRGGQLHCTTVMRSNDAVKGLAYDMPWFVGLLHRMAAEVGAAVGTYSHMAHSMHLYERDVPVAMEMLGEG